MEKNSLPQPLLFDIIMDRWLGQLNNILVLLSTLSVDCRLHRMVALGFNHVIGRFYYINNPHRENMRSQIKCPPSTFRCLALEVLVQGYLPEVTREPEKVWEVDPSTTWTACIYMWKRHWVEPSIHIKQATGEKLTLGAHKNNAGQTDQFCQVPSAQVQ